MFKFPYKNTIARSVTSSGVFIVISEQISHISLVFFIVYFEQANGGWENWNWMWKCCYSSIFYTLPSKTLEIYLNWKILKYLHLAVAWLLILTKSSLSYVFLKCPDNFESNCFPAHIQVMTFRNKSRLWLSGTHPGYDFAEHIQVMNFWNTSRSWHSQ